MTDLSSHLADLAHDLAVEQQWYDDVRKLWRESLGSGDWPEEKREKIQGWLLHGATVRRERAEELRELAEKSPQSIRAGLFRLALILETSADPIQEAVCELATMPPDPDEPLPGNRFRYAGHVHEDLPPAVWKLLSAMWGHDERNMYDVSDEIWDVSGNSELKSAMTKLKRFLKGIGYPRYLSKARKTDFLFWKVF